MEQDKPFKSIEVIDARTGQVCKIACMSCIRGHRTTSCGLQVCRNKILWTVKRPGRPLNSCTCRFGATGRCQCVVAKSACPHKPKKGEKRSHGCRCDEQGRLCCVLDQCHWDALLSLQNASVDFYPTPEALQAGPPTILPPTPSRAAEYLRTVNSLPSTPGSLGNDGQAMTMLPLPFNHGQSPTPVPRFGMMGVGTPWGNSNYQKEDVLAWEGQAPEAPRDYRPYADIEQTESHTVASQTSAVVAPTTGYRPIGPLGLQPQNLEFAPVTESFQQMSMPSQDLPPAAFDFDKLTSDYINYRFPFAICQKCGLNGCTCRNCPPVMQNSSNGSWGQGCARKHTLSNLMLAPAPQRLQDQDHVQPHAQQAIPADIDMTSGVDPCCAPDLNFDDFKMSDAEITDLAKYLESELDQPMDLPSSGCCCED